MSNVSTNKGYMSLEWRLKVVMAMRDISAKDLSEKTGLSYTTIIKLRNTVPSRYDGQTLEKLCEVLKCNVGDLIHYVPNKNAT
jgi:putative transcriptional regulator